jgi:hypothetical protein
MTTRAEPLKVLVLTLALALAASLLVLVGPLTNKALSQTAPSGTLDAHFSPNTFNSNSAVDATLKAAQTFTAVNTGKVTDAQAYVRTHRSGDLTMQITTVDSSGNPTDHVLASTTIADPPLSDLSVDPQPVTGNFSKPASVVSGKQYALVLSTTATNSPHNVWGTFVVDQPAGPYAGGEAMYKYDTQAAWQPRSSATISEDWGFAIYVDVVGQPPGVGQNAGLVGNGTWQGGELRITAQLLPNGSATGKQTWTAGASGDVTQVVAPSSGVDSWCINVKRNDPGSGFETSDQRINWYVRDIGDGVTTFDEVSFVTSIGGDCTTFPTTLGTFIPLSDGDFKAH